MIIDVLSIVIIPVCLDILINFSPFLLSFVNFFPINLKVIQALSVILGVNLFPPFDSMLSSPNHLSPSSGTILFLLSTEKRLEKMFVNEIILSA